MHFSKEQLTQKKYFYEIVLALLAFAFLAIFDSSSSFINIFDGPDESTFKLFGLALAKGKVPLRDYVDRKGPYLFLINAIPYFTHTYRGGLFIIQFIHLYISSLLIFKALRTIIAKHTAFLALLGMYAFYAIFYGEGGPCEGYELLYITISLYLCYSFVYKKKKPSEHPYPYTVAYGICFGIIAFIRVNDTATICGILIAFMYLLIREKKIGTLFAHAGCFVFGLLIASLPVVIYYAANHAIEHMVYWNFIDGFSYNSKSFADYVKTYSTRLFLFVPLFLALYIAKKTDKKENTYFFPVTIAITAMLYYAIGTLNSNHYFIVILPFYAVAIAYLLTVKGWLALLLIFCHFLPQWYNGFNQRPGFLLKAWSTVNELTYYKSLKNFQQQARDMYLSVPEHERERIFSYNISHGRGFYTINNVLPPNRTYLFSDLDSWQEDWKEIHPQYVLYQTEEDWIDDGSPLVAGYHELSRIDALDRPRHSFMLHLLEKD